MARHAPPDGSKWCAIESGAIFLWDSGS